MNTQILNGIRVYITNPVTKLISYSFLQDYMADFVNMLISNDLFRDIIAKLVKTLIQCRLLLVYIANLVREKRLLSNSLRLYMATFVSDFWSNVSFMSI